MPNTQKHPQPLLISVEEACLLLGGIHRITLWRMYSKRGELRTVKIGSRRLVVRQSLDDFIASQAESD
jgi:excisionase family DNA binding protein